MPSLTFMPLAPTTVDVLLRLALTVVAGALIGFDRGMRGHAAGLRTTILVGVAAALAMTQANELLSVSGKTSASFGVMDLMRMPLGILTGVGFIGGGAILHKGDFVTGITTAATLWVVTVIGLCFGGGQIWLGIAGTVIAVVTLWSLKFVDIRIPREQKATIRIKRPDDSHYAELLPALLGPLGFSTRFLEQREDQVGQRETLRYEVRWHRAEIKGPPLDLLKLVSGQFVIVTFQVTSEFRED